MAKAANTSSKPEPMNTVIMRLLIRHAVFIERYKSGLVGQVLRLFNRDVAPDIERKLLKHLNKDTITAGMVRELAKELSSIIPVYEAMHEDTIGELKRFAANDAQWEAETLTRNVGISGIDFTLPPPATLEALASKSYVRGALMKDWFKELGNQTRNGIVRAVNIGMVEGEGVDQIVRRIKGTRAANYTDGILNASRRNIEAIVRTSVQTVNGDVRKALYEANSDVIKGERRYETLDDRTCQQCMALDGKEYELGKAPHGPLHWNCRGGVTPILKSWKEMGIDLKEAPEGTRASMNGQVPSSVTYGKWLKQQPGSVQDEVLGPGKAALFRRGTVPMDKFVDARNKPLTLKELMALETRLNKAG